MAASPSCREDRADTKGGNAQKVAKSDPNPDGMLEGPVGSVAKLRYG